MERCRRSRRLRKGSVLIEFSLSMVVWVPLLLGTIFVGLNIVRAIEVTQICRDSGHMFASGIDFSQSANQKVLLKLASEWNWTSTSGDGVLILSQITFVTSQDCEAVGLPANCPNVNQAVFTQRLVIGNRSLRTSDFGAPPQGDMDASGNISQKLYVSDPSTRAGNFNSVLGLQSGQHAFLAEAYFVSPDLDVPGITSGSGTYSRAIF